MTEELKEFLKDLDSEGFKADTIEAFDMVGNQMVAYGMEPAEAVGHLESIKSAMKNEYGD